MELYRFIRKQYAPGIIFTFDELENVYSSLNTLQTQLSRLVKSGLITRFEKGAYYIPGKDILGEPCVPDYDEHLRYICKKYQGYQTGDMIYNDIGLTEQVPVSIHIATPKTISKKNVTVGAMDIILVHSYSPHPAKKNIPYLQLLDAIKDIERVQGALANEVYVRLCKLIGRMKYEDVIQAAKLSECYPPRVIFTLSKLLINCGYRNEAMALSKKIKSNSKFKSYGDKPIIS